MAFFDRFLGRILNSRVKCHSMTLHKHQLPTLFRFAQLRMATEFDLFLGRVSAELNFYKH